MPWPQCFSKQKKRNKGNHHCHFLSLSSVTPDSCHVLCDQVLHMSVSYEQPECYVPGSYSSSHLKEGIRTRGPEAWMSCQESSKSLLNVVISHTLFWGDNRRLVLLLSDGTSPRHVEQVEMLSCMGHYVDPLCGVGLAVWTHCVDPLCGPTALRKVIPQASLD